MNKCIKIIVKNCEELDWKELNKILYELRYKNWLACNKAMTKFYAFALENMEYKDSTGLNINEKERFGKTHGAVVQDIMKDVMDISNTGNVAQTSQFVNKRFKDDVKKGVFKGNVSLSNFKQDIPIIIKNSNYKIINNDKNYKMEVSLFNNKYKKENNIKKLNFNIDKLGKNEKTILDRIISGEYKQGSVQLQINKKKKWEIIISYGFEAEIKELNSNKTLGVDLGITKVATMQVFNIETEKWDRINWKECFIDGKELIHYRQQIEIRRRQLQIASKVVGEGRIGHGIKTRMKPVEKLNDKIHNFRDTYNHKVSKYIVNMAVKYDCKTIQMEDLTGFSEQQIESFLKNWSYYDLQTKIKYKAKEVGIKVILINPKYTSKRCSKCGNIHEENRDCKSNQAKFKCIICGHEENADINASKNISIPYIDKIIEEYMKDNKDYKKVI